jgi:hypothetical protein
MAFIFIEIAGMTVKEKDLIKIKRTVKEGEYSFLNI